MLVEMAVCEQDLRTNTKKGNWEMGEGMEEIGEITDAGVF